MVNLVPALGVEKSIVAIFIIFLIFIVRSYLNKRSFSYAVMILWALLLLYLISPFLVSFQVKLWTYCKAFRFLLQGHILFYLHMSLILKAFYFYIPFIRRVPVAVVLAIYIFYQGYKRLRVISKAKEIKLEKVNVLIKEFHIRRKVTLMVNDEISVPLTLGVIKPKIILQSTTLEEPELLHYVLLHELTHIKNFHLVWNQVKFIITCFYWYNPVIWLINRYIERDLEILCDKLVLRRIGFTPHHAKEYSLAMLNLSKRISEEQDRFTLKLHPTLERIVTIKKWKITAMGIFIFILSFTLISLSFATFEEIFQPPTGNTGLIKEKINGDGRTKVFSEEEKDDPLIEDDEIGHQRAYIDERRTLEGLETCRYDFRMLSWTGPHHERIVTKVIDTFTAGDMSFTVVIYQDRKIIYEGVFDGDVTLTTTQCKIKSKYTIAVLNQSLSPLNFRIRILTYID